MQFAAALLVAFAAVGPALADDQTSHPSVPSLDVPQCPKKGTIQYDTSVPNRTHDFPLTQVDLCYDDQAIRIDFTAYNESYFFYNTSYTTNDPIYNYEVMEAFIYQGTKDPQTYVEFEVAPNNVTFNAFIYNPSKVRAPGAPFDGGYIRNPIADGLTANTTMDKAKHYWKSNVRLPLGLWNVDNGQAKGTPWRMNFFRTVVNPKTPSVQLLGSWNPPNQPNFHETPYFGNIRFV